MRVFRSPRSGNCRQRRKSLTLRRVRRLRRILFITLTVLSLALSLLAAGLWVRTKFFVSDLLSFIHSDGPRRDGLSTSRIVFLNAAGGALQLRCERKTGQPGVSMASRGLTHEPYFRSHVRPRTQPFASRTSTPVSIRKDRWFGLLGFGYEQLDYTSSPATRHARRTESIKLTMPLWPWIIGGLVLPVVFVVRRRPYRARGCCPACGYDLRGTPERCPECGAVPAAMLS